MARRKSSSGILGTVVPLVVALGGGSGILALLGAAKSERAVGKGQRPSASAPRSDQETAEPIGQPVEFTLYDRLAKDQVSKYLSLSVDGKPAGTLSIDEAHPSGTLKVTVPKAGAHVYALDGVLTVRGFLGRQRQVKGHGRAAIEVAPGRTFEPQVELTGNNAQLSLRPAIAAAE